ncbi:hypothetical protein GQ457_16G018730 [Hibiscus cannabinus]
MLDGLSSLNVIKYKKGKDNILADALSRISHCCLGSVVLTSTILGFEHIKDLYPNDPDFSYIYNHCLEGAFNKFYLVEDFLFRMNRLCIPQGSIREFLVHESHSGGLMGHFGVTKTLDMVMEHFSFGHICVKQWKRIVIRENTRHWEECLPFVEFAYNRSIHTTTGYSPFEVVYGFNPLTTFDLVPLPLDHISSIDGEKKADLVKSIHAKVKQRMEKTYEPIAKKKINKGRRQVIFEPGDWVWVHLRKERFPNQWKCKLDPRGDGPFQVIERINDNAYHIDLPGEYNVSSSFTVSDLFPFDISDSKPLE